MQLISIDLGSYSVKLLKFRQDKNKTIFDYASETIVSPEELVPPAPSDGEELADLEEDQTDLRLKASLAAAKEMLSGIDGDYRIVMNVPFESITTRFLDLPVNNKKKAQMMIPFQLEEDIPYGLGEIQIGSSIEVGKVTSKALVNIAERNVFSSFFEQMSEQGIAPRILTSQDSVIQTFIKNNKEVLPQSFCVLDIGHETAKAFFFFENELVAIHKSHVAGRALSEVIAETYKIDFDEATLYKHQNAFFLTSDQYDQVNENQKTFAIMMERAFAPLTHEFKRWEIGQRVQQGVGVSEVFITGGCSNIKNIHNFLAEKFQTKTSYLDTFDETVDSRKIDSDEKFRRKFFNANLMAQGYRRKSSLVNMLNGEFTIQGHSDLPLQSFAFIATRAAFVTLLLMVSFGVERLVMYKDSAELDKSLVSISKNPVLELGAPQKRYIRSGQIDRVLKDMRRKEKAIEQEISVLQASAKTNALSPLTRLANIVTGMDVEVLQFNAISGGDFNVKFKTDSLDQLNSLDRALNASGIKNAFTDRNESKLTLDLSGTEE